MRRKVLAVAVGALLVSSACSGGDDDGDPTTTSRKEPTTTVDEIDPSVIPDDITPEYVEAVLTELYDVQRRAVQSAIDDGLPTDETLELFKAIYTSELSSAFISSVGESASDDYSDYKNPVGAVATSVTRVLTASQECLSAEVELDYVDVSPTGRASEVIIRLDPLDQLNDGNPTRWIIGDTEPASDGDDPCDA